MSASRRRTWRGSGLLEQDAVEGAVLGVERHHGTDEARDDAVEAVAGGGRLGGGAFEDRLALGEVRLHERHEQRVLAREVLVQRPDRHAGPVGDVVRGRRGIAAGRENLSRGPHDGVDRRARARLTRPFSGSKLVGA
jgi:hypothetical protein